MSPAMASLRHLIPRASLSLHSRQLQHRLLLPAIRTASSAPPKPRVLEKPERFNPPSHPSRLRSRPRQYPGPPLSEHERRAQQTRRYPHMMPAEGTFMHWFLTSRGIHLVITGTVLVSLVLLLWLNDFLYTTPYASLLPPNSMFFTHPLAFLKRYWEVYDMHIAYTTEQVAEKRRQKVADVRKRAEYRKAHGIEEEHVFGGWTAKSDEEMLGGGMKESGLEGGAAQVKMDGQTPRDGAGKGGQETFVDFEGNTQPVKKKWFGIW